MESEFIEHSPQAKTQADLDGVRGRGTEEGKALTCELSLRIDPY